MLVQRRPRFRDPFTPDTQHELAAMVAEILDVAKRDGTKIQATAAELGGTPNQILAMAITEMISERLREGLPRTHPFLKEGVGQQVACLVLAALDRFDAAEYEVRGFAEEQGVPFNQHVGAAIALLVVERFRKELPKNP